MLKKLSGVVRLMAAAALLPVCLIAVGADFSGRRAQISDSLRSCLPQASTAADSLKIYYNLYDLGTAGERHQLETPLYLTAKRAGDMRARLDILRLIGNSYLGNDSAQTLVLEEAERLPRSKEQRETATFLRLLRTTTRALYTTTEEKDKWVHEALKLYHSIPEKADTLKQLELLYSVCIYLGAGSRGELFQDYIDKSEEFISSLPYGLYAIRNMFYAHTAIIRSSNLQYDKAVECDKHLLAIMAEMERRYVENGRIYRNYDRNRYICYRRMLSNYPALSPREIEECYSKIQEIKSRDGDVAADDARYHFADAYYYVATGRYAEALPLLSALVDQDIKGNSFNKPRLYMMYIKAAQEAGDKEALLHGLELQNGALKELLHNKSRERYRELQVIYDVEHLDNEKTRILAESHASLLRSHRLVIAVSVISGVVLAALCVILWLQYGRARKMGRNLATANSKLKQESEALRNAQSNLIVARDAATRANKLKTEFVNNVSHEIREPLHAIAGYSQLIADSIGGDGDGALQKYANIVSLNVDLVQKIVGDVLDMNAIERNLITVVKHKTTPDALCTMAVESIKPNRRDGVTIEYIRSAGGDTSIITDPQRVEQVLINLLQNGVKFTREGKVTLAAEVDEGKKTVRFVVTDTGPGIPADKSEVIFERFEKLNSFSQGVGLGLPVSRLVAKLLKGRVWLDTSYHSGARFIFEIPLERGDQS